MQLAVLFFNISTNKFFTPTANANYEALYDTTEVLEIENGKVSVIRKYSE